MSEEDKLIQQELIEEIMKASEQFPNAILYMETVMRSYEELEKENQALKEIVEEAKTAVDYMIGNVDISEIHGTKLKQILDRAGDIDEKKN